MFESTMMDFPLTVAYILERGRTFFPRGEVVSKLGDKSIHRYTYGEMYGRVCQLAHALAKLGVGDGTRGATLSWNHHRHLETYMAVPAMGAVMHTLNLRLLPTDLRYIASHAGDEVLIADR